MQQNNHRKSIRLPHYDYSQNGAYFITICVKDKKCLFGEIIDGKMIMNDLGKQAEKCWKEIPKHFPDMQLDRFIIMPNHVHGIIFIEKSDVGANNHSPNEKTAFQSPSRTIGSVVRGFKIGVKKWANANDKEFFSWQRNYHEHIIRNEKSLNMIQEYIFHNPQTWKKDCFFMQ